MKILQPALGCVGVVVDLITGGKPMDWQPIETAPKYDVYLVFCEYYSIGEDDPYFSEVRINTDYAPFNGVRTVTHWQPLPEPPK